MLSKVGKNVCAQEESKMGYFRTIFFAIVLFCITFGIVSKFAIVHGTDYGIHSSFAMNLGFGNIFEKFSEDPHILWHILVRIVWEIIGQVPENIGYAAGIVSGFFACVSFVGTYFFISRFVKVGAAEMAFAVSLVGPLYMPWMNSNYYLGQGTPNTWHNPTNLAVKIFAIIIFWEICNLLNDVCQSKEIRDIGDKNTMSRYMRLCVISVILAVSVVAKPSFIMAFIPGLGLWMVIRCVIEKFRNVKIYLGICLLFIPAVLIMLYQYLTFFGQSSEAGIGIELFRSSKYYTNHPLISSLLALFFPLLFLILNFKREIIRTDTQLAISYVSVA